MTDETLGLQKMTLDEALSGTADDHGADIQMNRLAELVQEMGFLKSVPRTGWTLAGVKTPESVADHSMRTAAIAYLLAVLAGVDTGRAVALAIFHDLAEVRTSDLASVTKQYVKKESDESVVRDQMAGCHPAVQEALGGVVAEYGRKETAEARLAHDADKLECLAQALQYRAEGHVQAQLWIDSMTESIRTPQGRALADALLRAEPGAWWRNIVAGYRPALPPEAQA